MERKNIPHLSKIILITTSVIMLVFFVIPHIAFASSTLYWTPFTEDPDTGQRTYGTELAMQNNGTYELSLHTLGETFIQVDTPIFNTEGVLFHISNPEDPTPTREFIENFNNFDDISFSQAGVYELDIYEINPPILIRNPIQKAFAWFFATPVSAQNPDLFIGTIRFTITEVNAEPPEPDPVIIVPGILGSAFKNGLWVLDPIRHIYDNLVDTLVGNGYVYDQTIFTFPYDWMQSNEITAEELKTKIDAVKAQTGASKVDLVAHSMGGLVARQYIESPNYGHDVDQLIFLGTPHLGAPLAYLMYDGGEINISGPGDILLSLYLSHLAHEAGFSNLYTYIHSGEVESIRELLPVYDYLFDETNNLLDYPSGYPTNPFLEDLNGASDYLSLSGVKVTNIVGSDNQNDTVNSLNIKVSDALPYWAHGEPTALNQGVGDGTVPLFSAAPSFIDSSTTVASDHTGLPTKAEGLVYSTLTNKTPSFLADASLAERFLILRAFSPIDIQITAPDGNRVGKDFDTDQEFNEIPGAFYSGFDTNVEYIVIPNPQDGQYVVSMQGADSAGMYTLSTNYIDHTENTETNISGVIEHGEITEAVATLSATSAGSVVVEQSLVDLVAYLKEVIRTLDISNKQKLQLLDKVAHMEEKITQREKRQEQSLLHLKGQIEKKVDNGKINADSITDITELLDQLIAKSPTIPIDKTLLNELKNQINILEIKPKLKNSFLKKINKLENLAVMNRSLSQMISLLERKENKGILSEADLETLLSILDKIQGVL